MSPLPLDQAIRQGLPSFIKNKRDLIFRFWKFQRIITAAHPNPVCTKIEHAPNINRTCFFHFAYTTSLTEVHIKTCDIINIDHTARFWFKVYLSSKTLLNCHFSSVSCTKWLGDIFEQETELKWLVSDVTKFTQTLCQTLLCN